MFGVSRLSLVVVRSNRTPGTFRPNFAPFSRRCAAVCYQGVPGIRRTPQACVCLPRKKIIAELFIFYILNDLHGVFHPVTVTDTPFPEMSAGKRMSFKRIQNKFMISCQFFTGCNLSVRIEKIPSDKRIKSVPAFTAVFSFVPYFVKCMAVFVGSYASCFYSGGIKGFSRYPAPSRTFMRTPRKYGKRIEAPLIGTRP
jgi:hypothetical protein